MAATLLLIFQQNPSHSPRSTLLRAGPFSKGDDDICVYLVINFFPFFRPPFVKEDRGGFSRYFNARMFFLSLNSSPLGGEDQDEGESRRQGILKFPLYLSLPSPNRILFEP
jgi:hypothetical protein